MKPLLEPKAFPGPDISGKRETWPAYVKAGVQKHGYAYIQGIELLKRLPAVSISPSVGEAFVHPLPAAVTPVARLSERAPSPWSRFGRSQLEAAPGYSDALEVTICPLMPQMFSCCPFPTCGCGRFYTTAGVAEPHTYLLADGGTGIVVGLDLHCADCKKSKKSWDPEVRRVLLRPSVLHPPRAGSLVRDAALRCSGSTPRSC